MCYYIIYNTANYTHKIIVRLIENVNTLNGVYGLINNFLMKCSNIYYKLLF